MKTSIFLNWRGSFAGYHPRFFSSDSLLKSLTSKSKVITCFGHSSLEELDLQNQLLRCAEEKSIVGGESCHALVVQLGLQSDTLISNILINVYSKCGFLECARTVFDEMPVRSVVSWNTMISAHMMHGEEQEGIKLFMRMHNEGITPSEFTVSTILCACAAESAVGEGKQLHAFAIKTALCSNVYVGTALVDVYAKCNSIRDACHVFEVMSERSEVTWSSMAAGYVQNGLYEEALMLFHSAQKMGLLCTPFTLSATLAACASLSATIEGTQVHSILVREGLDSNLIVATSLVDMYAKCGSIEDAYVVFAAVKEKNIVLWNAMIGGFAKHACSSEVMLLFEKMQQAGFRPNEVTYISVLSACSHAGLVERGGDYFALMTSDPTVQVNVLHYSCMVDLLGRAGLVKEAWSLIVEMPFQATASMWGSLLGSCRIHGHLELAEVAADHLFKMEPNNAGNHVLLSNVYASNKRWGEVMKARKHLKESGAKKEIGKSWVEVKDQVHTFVVGERNHPCIFDIHAKLDELEKEMKKLNYKAKVENDLHDVEAPKKEELLRFHSEKLALAFGLISLPSDAPIKIKKNLRICGDCHSTLKFVSRITKRLIIVRDTTRFHHFKNDTCSCRDF